MAVSQQESDTGTRRGTPLSLYPTPAQKRAIRQAAGADDESMAAYALALVLDGLPEEFKPDDES